MTIENDIITLFSHQFFIVYATICTNFMIVSNFAQSDLFKCNYC